MKRTLAALLVCAMAMSMSALPALALESQGLATDTQPAVETEPSTPGDGSLLGDPTVPDSPEDGSLLGKPTVPDGPEENDPPQNNTPSTGEDEGDDTPEETDPPVTPEQPTAVLTKNHVLYLAGFPDRCFQPDQTLTRAQGAQIVYRLLENPRAAPTSGTCPQTTGPLPKLEPPPPWAGSTAMPTGPSAPTAASPAQRPAPSSTA